MFFSVNETERKGCCVKDKYKKKAQLISELDELRHKIARAETQKAKRRQLETKLKSSKEYLDKIINSISDPLFVKDSRHRLVLVNDAECHLAGCTRKELLGKTDYDFFPKEQVDIFWEKDDEVLKTGQENINEEEITDAEGNKRVIVTKKTLYVDKAGNRFIVGIIRDVTERKRAEELLQEAHDNLEMHIKERTFELEAINKQLQDEIVERKKIERELRISQERFRALTESTSDWIWEIDKNAVYTYASPKIKDILGYEPEEVIGKTPFDFMPQYEARQLAGIFKTICRSGKAFASLESKNLHKSGRIVFLETSGVPIFDINGNLTGYRGIDRDITKRKRSEEILRENEERFRATFEQVAVGVAHLDVSGRFLMVNQRMCDIVGYTREELIVKKFQDITHPEDLAPDSKNIQQMLANKIRTYSMEKRYLCKDGSSIWVNLTKSLVRDPAGKPLYFISVTEDISQHKKLEEQLFQAQKMEAIGQLAGGVAHDFNNLLTAIIGYGSLLRAEIAQDDKLCSYTQQILSAAERAATLTNDLLTFSRKQLITPRPVDLNKIIRDIEKLLSRIIGEDIELTTAFPQRELPIVADSTQIEQVLLNLATNARDAMPLGGTLIISTDRADLDREFISTHGYGKSGPYAILSFEDSGTGMDERTRERIFEPFFTTKEVGKGTGLGLAIVYGIIKQHDGYINAYSEPGKGTTFKIYFPLFQAAIEDEKPAEIPAISKGSETILLGEDDPFVRHFIKEVLLKNGYTIIEAADGAEAVTVFHEYNNTIDLVILDVIMPKKTGKDAYREIKALNSGVRVLFISGYSADIIHKRGILDEEFKIISKPIISNELLAKVREILDT
jgi:PAS domain S-box-containing protein